MRLLQATGSRGWGRFLLSAPRYVCSNFKLERIFYLVLVIVSNDNVFLIFRKTFLKNSKYSFRNDLKKFENLGDFDSSAKIDEIPEHFHQHR